MNNFIFDARWKGDSGIGRFAREIHTRLNFNRTIDVKIKPTNPFDIFVTPFYLLFNKDFFFTPGFNAPFFFAKRSLITIHDLNHIDTKANSNILKRLYYRIVLKRACKHCQRIFTVSEFSKHRINEWSGVGLEKIIVVGNGISPKFNSSIEANKYDIKYFLCISNRKKHKNEERLLEAFSRTNCKDNYKLIFSGLPDKNIKEIITKLKMENIVQFTGFIPEEELPILYKGATGLVFPSLYEGFGLPVVEAMACGVPVITSNTTSLSEIANGAALMVDPLDVFQITIAIDKLASDEQLRKKLIAKGFENVKRFSWDKTASIILKELNEVIDSRMKNG